MLDLSDRFVTLGFRPLVDFEVERDEKEVRVKWLSKEPMPDMKTLEAVEINLPKPQPALDLPTLVKLLLSKGLLTERDVAAAQEAKL